MLSHPPHNAIWRPRLFWGIVFLFSALHVRGDQVTLFLKNGDRLTGAIISETTNEVTLESALIGEVKVPVSEINNREKKLVTILPSPSSGTNITVVSKSSTNVSALKPPEAPKPIPPNHWSLEGQVGANLRYSAKDQQEYFATLKTGYARDRFRQIFDYSFSYGKTEGIVSANRMNGAFKTDYDLDKRWYAYNLMSAGYDEIRKVDVQYEVGPGMGYNVFQGKNKMNFVLKQELGFTYQHQFRSDDTEQTTYSARIASLFAWKPYDKLAVEGKVEFFPNLESGGDYRLRVETTLKYLLLKNVSLNLNVIDLYDTLPAQGVTPNDLQIRSAIGLKF